MSEFSIKKSYRSSESIRLWVGVVSDCKAYQYTKDSEENEV